MPVHLRSSFGTAARFALTPLALCLSQAVWAQAAPAAPAPADSGKSLTTVNVNASADASAAGLSPAYAGGQVARGGRAGILGTRDNMDTPFAITSFTNELIQNQQSRSVGDVLQNDASIRVARGFGNFQESYFIRGFLLSSDYVGYNGLYSLLPRQYISSELFERVEVLHGASTFLTGATPGGDGIGGVVNLLPKRATNEPLTQVTLGVASGGQSYVATDISRRFGPDQSTGVRVNAAHRSGGTAVDNEDVKLAVASVGLDWRSRDVRLSADVGYQNHKLSQTRTNVTLNGATSVPVAPDSKTNWAQPGSYSNERDTFGTVRGEVDINSSTTAWFAAGARHSNEANSLANLNVGNGSTGAGTTYRFDNTGGDSIKTGEVGVRGKVVTGPLKHELVASYAYFQSERKNAYVFDFGNTQATNLYNPVLTQVPAFSAGAFGFDLSNPVRTNKKRLTSYAIADTLSFIDDTLLVTLGARHQTLQTTNYAYGTGVVTPGNGYDANRVSPAGGVVFKVSKQLSVYGNYIESLSAGEIAPALSGTLPVANAGAQLSPYVAKQKEIGVKYDGGRLGASLALFSTDRPRSFRNATTGIFGTEGKDNHQGAELNVFGEPMRGLRLLGGVTLLDAKQKTTGDATTDGKKVIGVPNAQASFNADWDVPGVRGLALNGRVTAGGSSYADSANTLKVPGWARFDVGARYAMDVQGKLLTLRARVDNLFDRNYWSSVGGYTNAGYLVAGAPRTFSLTASFDF